MRVCVCVCVCVLCLCVCVYNYYCFTQVVAMSNMLAEALAEEDNLLGIARSTSVCGLKLLVYEALSYQWMRPSATSV